MLKQAIAILLTCTTAFCYAQTSNEYVQAANKLYDVGKKDEAKILYEKAAGMNNADAHYALAYKYVTNDNDRIYHFAEAAKMGHQEATSEVIEALFLRSSSLTTTNPKLAYDIYLQAKKSNPHLVIYAEDEVTQTLKECIEAGPLDADAFIKRYKITEQDTNDNDYSVWELAEEASKDGRFGKPDPHLVLQLACAGGIVPAEKEMAVNAAYHNWKDNKVLKFDPCNFVTSGIGLAYCSNRTSAEAENKYSKQIKKLAPQLRNNAGALLEPAYKAADAFIMQKAFNEEGSDGSGHVAWSNESADKQKADYIAFVRKVNNGFQPKLNNDEDYDKVLNDTYRRVMAELKQQPISGVFFSMSDDNLRGVQRQWIKYRDASAHLFAAITPSISEQEWKNYLTRIRTEQIKAIPKLRE